MIAAAHLNGCAAAISLLTYLMIKIHAFAIERAMRAADVNACELAKTAALLAAPEITKLGYAAIEYALTPERAAGSLNHVRFTASYGTVINKMTMLSRWSRACARTKTPKTISPKRIATEAQLLRIASVAVGRYGTLNRTARFLDFSSHTRIVTIIRRAGFANFSEFKQQMSPARALTRWIQFIEQHRAALENVGRGPNEAPDGMPSGAHPLDRVMLCPDCRCQHSASFSERMRA